MVTLIDGLVGGFIATIVMTILMMVLGDDTPPPTALFWSKFVGDGEPSDFMMQGMVLHLLYGVMAGGAFAVIASFLDMINVAALETAILWGLVYGVALFVGAAVFWMKLILGIEPERKMVGMFLFFHLIYGAILGAWIGVGVFG